jgi:DnaJ domain
LPADAAHCSETDMFAPLAASQRCISAETAPHTDIKRRRVEPHRWAIDAKQQGGVVWPRVPRATAPRLISNVRLMANPHETLGVAPNASQDDIRKAAKETHPDLNPGKPEAEKHFKEINAAYDIISDADKRKRYDAGEIDEAGYHVHMNTPEEDITFRT